LQDKYQLPPPEDPSSLLARHEQGLFDELKQSITRDEDGNTNHRSETFAQTVTPRARDLVQAIGHRFAYESALSSGHIRKELVNVWEADCILQDPAWYVEHAGMTNREIHQKYTTAIECVRPSLGEIMEEFGMEKHFGSIPLVSKEHWDDFIDELPTFANDIVLGKS
jgi:acyl-CoA oxidase